MNTEAKTAPTIAPTTIPTTAPLLIPEDEGGGGITAIIKLLVTRKLEDK